MKIKILSAILAICSFVFILTACKKDSNSGSTSTDPTTELTAQADDQNQVSTEVDAVADDANTSLSSSSGMSGRVENLICDATVAIDTTSDPKKITITYNGSNCSNNRTRTGIVVISMAKGVHWKDAGAAVTINIQNLKITRMRDNKSITINGTKTYTNVSGGLLANLASLGTIIHTITSSGLTITFDNGTQRTWQVSRQRTFTYNNGITISETGTHTDGTNAHIAEWGINRFGNAFTTSINEPIVVSQSCDFRIISGSITHVVPKYSASVTFGLDSNGSPVSCPSGNYYMEVSWTGVGGATKSVLLPY